MKILRKAYALIYPDRCPYCEALIEPCEIACSKCLDEIKRKHTPIRCGALGYRCVASFVYDGKVRRMILRLKYHQRIQFVDQINAILIRDIKDVYGEDAFDLVTCVPMHKDDRKKREYNQSKLLAVSLSKMLGVPYLDTLEKVKNTKKQHLLKYAERKTNLAGAFELINKEAIRDKRILIVDDIITSGNTLGKCCKVLSRGKPELICCAAIASARDKYPESTVI